MQGTTVSERKRKSFWRNRKPTPKQETRDKLLFKISGRSVNRMIGKLPPSNSHILSFRVFFNLCYCSPIPFFIHFQSLSFSPFSFILVLSQPPLLFRTFFNVLQVSLFSSVIMSPCLLFLIGYSGLTLSTLLLIYYSFIHTFSSFAYIIFFCSFFP